MEDEGGVEGVIGFEAIGEIGIGEIAGLGIIDGQGSGSGSSA